MNSHLERPWEGSSVAVAAEIPVVSREPSQFTELRIHGAGGARLNKLLDTADVVQVAGDEDAGFYQPADETIDLEAYHWERFNSGGGWRAGWVLLVPFLFGNLTGWFLPRENRALQAAARLFGLGLTVTAVYWAAAIATDLIFLQCGGQALCVDDHFWLPDWLFGGFVAGHPGRRFVIGLVVPALVLFVLWNWPGRRSADRYERFGPAANPSEQDEGVRSGAEADDAPALSKDHDRLWFGDAQTRRLVGLHVLAALATLAAGTSGAAWWLNGRDRDLGGLITFVSAAVVLATCVLAVLPDAHRPYRDRERLYDLVAWLLGGVLLVSAAGYMWFDAPTDHEGSALLAERLLAGYFANGGFIAIVAVLFVIVVLFLLAAWRMRRRPIPLGAAGAAGAAVVLLGMLLSGTALWTADLLGERRGGIDERIDGPLADDYIEDLRTVLDDLEAGPDVIEEVDDVRAKIEMAIDAGPSVADLQQIEANSPQASLMLQVAIFEAARPADDGDALTAEDKEALRDADVAIGEGIRDLSQQRGEVNEALSALGTPQIVVFPSYDFAALGGLALVAAAALVVGVVQWRARGIVPAEKVRSSLVGIAKGAGQASLSDGDDPAVRTWAKEVAGDLRQTVIRTRLVSWPMYVFAILAPLLLVLYVLLIFDLLPRDLPEVIEWLDFLLDPARWLLIGVLLGAGWVVQNAFRPGSTDSTLGGLWDVSTFWPRHFHPFAPPSYTLRAVPEFAREIDRLRSDDRTVLVSAHSQGVAIAIAAIASLDDARRVALLSYGSPTGSLYALAFPDYFECPQMVLFTSRLTAAPDDCRWRNLWRLTDWTGGYAIGPSEDRIKPIDDKFTSAEKHNREGVPGVVEVWIQDPTVKAIEDARPPLIPAPPPSGHHEYRQTKEYKAARRDLEAALVRERL